MGNKNLSVLTCMERGKSSPVITRQGWQASGHIGTNVRFEVFTAVTMKNAVFWDIKSSSYLTWNTLHLRYIVSRLILFRIWGFHGGDSEECRLLGNETPVRTSQETNYVSTTESSRLMLCKIWGFHGGDYEECIPLGYENLVPTS
jgi:hypothetical protein